MKNEYKVTIAHARMDENGKGVDGKAGDQTGREVLFEDWYISGGNQWDCVLRCKDKAMRNMIADNAEKAVRNPQIGYDMNQRYTLYDDVEDKGFDCSKTTKDVECDCSTLATVCCGYAGITIPRDTRTANMQSRYTATKRFKVLTANKYVKSAKYLKRGDILVRGGHHTSIVSNVLYRLERNLKTNCKGSDVKALQRRLNDLSVTDISLVVDGEFGAKSDMAVKAFQQMNNLEPDGIVGRKTAEALGFLYV